MKVKFIKGSKAGSVEEVSGQRANYLQRVGLAEEVTVKSSKPEEKETPKKTAPKKKK